jgi:broad specificity phosphatase PhoE
MSAPLLLHLVRHGEVAGHHGDIGVTSDGLLRAREAGRELARQLGSDEVVHFLHTGTLRARQTAYALREGTMETIAPDGKSRVLSPRESFGIRNPDIYVAGERVEMVSSPAALAERLAGAGMTEADCLKVDFFARFWSHPDRIGSWVADSHPPGEDADTVARRVLSFATSLRDIPSAHPRRYVCVTHSPVLRAVARKYLSGEDPGEPDWLESVDLWLADGEVHVDFRSEHAIS